MAELLEMLINDYDFPQLADSILRDVSSKEFDDSVKDLSVPRAFSKFLVKLSELSPKAVLKQMGLLIEHLDGEVRAVLSKVVMAANDGSSHLHPLPLPVL